MKDSIQIKLWHPSQQHEVVREMPCAHERDTPFESCWPMPDGYLKKTNPSPLRFKPVYNQLSLGYLPAMINGALEAGIFEALGKECASTDTLVSAKKVKEI